MKTRVLITIDTESDNMWGADSLKNPRFKNIENLSRLQRLFDSFHVRATYLVAYSVAKSDPVSVLKDIVKSSACEIGTHLHAMETPPFTSQAEGDGSFLHQYPVKVQEQKLANIHGKLCDVFGKKPVSYRGGRWSVDRDILSLLKAKGYLVDSSITPGISWKLNGGLNFKKCPRHDEFTHDGLLEVPASMMITTRFREIALPLYRNLPDHAHIEGLLRRLAGFDIIWLDPSFNQLDRMKWVCDEYIREGAGFVNVIFHSSVIIAGGSPYTMTQEKVDIFFHRLSGLLEYLLKAKGLESVTLKEYYGFRKANFN